MNDINILSETFAAGDYDKFSEIRITYDKKILKQLKPLCLVSLATRMDILDEYKISRNTFLYPSLLLPALTLLPPKYIHRQSAMLVTGSLISVLAFNQFQYTRMKYIIEGQKNIIRSMDDVIDR